MKNELTREQRIWNAAVRVSETFDSEFLSEILGEEDLPPEIVVELIYKILSNLNRLYFSTSKGNLARFLVFDYLDSCGRIGEEE